MLSKVNQNTQPMLSNMLSNVNGDLTKSNKSLTCENCNKVFKFRPSKSKHKKNCKSKQLDTEIVKLQVVGLNAVVIFEKL